MNRRILPLLFSVAIATLGAVACQGKFSSCEDTRTCDPPDPSEGGAPGTDEGGAPGMEEVLEDGDPCEVAGETACAGFDQKITLLCRKGAWEASTVCAADQNCNSETGLCADLDEECAEREAGDEFCGEDDNRYECGDDRVSRVLVEVCGSEGICDEGDSDLPTRCLTDCATENGGCDVLTSCTNSSSGPQCSECPSGYLGSGAEGCAPSLLELSLSDGELAPDFESDVFEYEISVPLIKQSITLTWEIPEDASLSIDGETVDPTAPWTTPTLDLGQNSFEVEVSQTGHPSSVYEVTVRRSEATYVKASNTGGADSFGSSVALSADGTTLAVGAPQEDSSASGVGGDQASNSSTNSGAIYIFTRVGGSWSQQAYLKASNRGDDDRFGEALALSADGNTLAVGAPDEDSSAQGVNGNQADTYGVNSGAAYVFTRNGTAWSQQAYVKASNTGLHDHFGSALALSGNGNVLVVAAELEDGDGVNDDQTDDSLEDAGAVYVFSREGTIWTQQAYIKPSHTDDGDKFGSSLSLSTQGDLLAVGVPREDGSATGMNGGNNNSVAQAGAVYVFARAGTTWSQQAYVKASNTGPADTFGTAVSLSGDGSTLAVGAPGEQSSATGLDGNQADNSVGGSGAVYIFERTETSWQQTAYSKASNTGVSDAFGDSVALSNDGTGLIVGAPGEGSNASQVNGNETNNDAPASGAAYVFHREGVTWAQRAYVKAPNAAASDRLGWSVAISADGSVIAVGAHFEDSNATGVNGDQTDNSASAAGAVYVF